MNDLLINIKNLLKNNFFINFLKFSVIIFLFIFLTKKMQYMYISNDDITDLICSDYTFFHGRIITELFEKFIVFQLPSFLGINVQNFAIISEVFIKILFFLVLIYYISISFFKFFAKNILFPILFIFNTFIVFAMTFQTKALHLFDTLQFFFGYIVPIIFFILFWFYLIDFYLKEGDIDNKKLFPFLFVTILNAFGNELFLCASFILSFLLLVDSIFHKYKIKYLFISLIANFFSFFIIINCQGFKAIYNMYTSSNGLNFSFDCTKLYSFFSVFFDKLILENSLILILILVFSFILLKMKKEFIYSSKIVKYIFYSTISLFTFFLLLYFIGPTFTFYQLNENYSPSQLYCILHAPLLFDIKVMFLVFVLFLFGIFFKNSKKNLNLYIVSILFFVIGILYIVKYGEIVDLSCYKNKKTMYMADKIAVHYLSKNKTIVLPKDNIDVILPYSNNLFPKDLESEAYIGRVYSISEYSYYFIYLYCVYNVRIYDAKIQFKPYDEAMQDFINDGGNFTDEELRKLDFSNIKPIEN